jgi:uncharacterized protein (DUF4415 family)
MTQRYKKELSLEELAALPDDQIDLRDSPELDESFWKNARLVLPEGKEKVSIRLDKDILEWFRGQKDRGYQSRINAVLRAYVEAHKGG